MLVDHLIDLNIALHRQGFYKEAFLLSPGILRYAEPLDISLKSPTSQKRVMTKLLQGIKGALGKAKGDTPLGVTAKVLIRFMPGSGIYGWLGDTSKCVVSLGDPGDKNTVNWLFDVENGQFTGTHSIAAETQWGQELRHYLQWLNTASKQLEAVEEAQQSGSDIKQIAEQLKKLVTNLNRFKDHIGEIVEEYAEATGISTYEFDFDFTGTNLDTLREEIQRCREILPDAIRYRQQRTVWVKVAQKTDEEREQRDEARRKRLEQLYQELRQVIEKHDEKVSPLGFCWKVAAAQVKIKLAPMQLMDNKHAILVVGDREIALIFTLTDGTLQRVIPYLSLIHI